MSLDAGTLSTWLDTTKQAGARCSPTLIAAQVRRWEFDVDEPERVVKLRRRVDISVPNPTIRAVMAIEASCGV